MVIFKRCEIVCILKLTQNTFFDISVLNRLVHKKAAFLDATNPAVNALNPELFGDVSAPSGPASPWGGADQAFRMPNLDDQFIDSELEHEDDSFQGGQRAEVLALIEAALKQGLPWDYYLSLAAKRSGSTLGALGYEDIMNQPRSLTRETRDDGRRYLMWRKITG